MIRTLATFAVQAALVASAITYADGVVVGSTAQAAGRTWQACATDEGLPFAEGGTRCVWDARHMGNGSGRSFFVNASGVHYVSHARAHSMVTR